MQEDERRIAARMHEKSMGDWTPEKKKHWSSLFSGRKAAYAAAASIALCIGAAVLINNEQGISVMSHIETGFEVDESIGRLQYVSNLLPQSAMVFLSSDHQTKDLLSPSSTAVVHAWNQTEPWIEYEGGGSIRACMDGEVMTIVKQRNGEHTVRLLHEDGFESIYSGLTNVQFKESDHVSAGHVLGSAKSYAGFEYRRDGLSVLPVFSAP